MDPPLRVREDWWVFERPNYFYFFECQESTCRLSKNLLSIKRGFSKAYKYFLDIRKNKSNWAFRKPTSPPLNLKFFSKINPSFFTIKEGSTAFPKPLSPQGTGDVPTALLGAQTASLYGWRTIRGLRQQRSCSFLCGDEPAFTQGFAKGLLAALGQP